MGAGTGKFTRGLLDRRLDVSAVEPDPTMRARLHQNFSEVKVYEGTAESLPLPDATADLVTLAQAWHWVDPEAASREIGRVLRRSGVLALIWNIRDERTDWVARLGEVIGVSAAEEYDSVAPTVTAPLHLADHAEFEWRNRMSRDELIAMVNSRSYVIAMSPGDRASVLEAVEGLLETDPELAGRTEYSMPYVTRVTIASR